MNILKIGDLVEHKTGTPTKMIICKIEGINAECFWINNSNNEQRASFSLKDLEPLKLVDEYSEMNNVYNEIVTFILQIGPIGHPNSEMLNNLILLKDRAKFIFGKDNEIITYIDNLYRKGPELKYKDELLPSADPEQESTHKLGEEIIELKEWFGEQLDFAHDLFEKYLQLKPVHL
jgi:uncharacterized protein YodC (DUF2158 family)